MMSACSVRRSPALSKPLQLWYHRSIRRSPALSKPLQLWYHQRCYHSASITSLKGSVATAQYDDDYHGEDEKSKHKKYSTTIINLQRRHISTNNKQLPSVLSKEAATASLNYPTSKRFFALPPAIGIHLAIGSVYVYSMWTPGMSKALGVVAAAPCDWTHSELLPVFSCAAVGLGITTSAMGEWVEKSGPRISGLLGSACWSGALLTAAAGVETHTLPLLYLGYGVFGAVGWGLMYITPVSAAMKWFPDRRGLATGIALSAFGAGAAVAPTVIHALVDYFFIAPDFVGDCLLTSGGLDVDGVTKPLVELTTLDDGSQVVASTSQVGKPGTPVVVATEADVAKISNSLRPGVYAIGTGDTGVSKAMTSLGVLYGGLGALASRFMKIPHPEWTPERSVTVTSAPTHGSEEKADAASPNNIGLSASYVTTNTMQFPLLWMSVFGNATGGLALLSSSKLMLTDIFAGVSPDIVTPAFSTGYVSALGVGMALGRFGWSALSDVLGRQNTYALFGLGIPIVGLTPYLCHIASGAESAGGEVVTWPLSVFYSGSVLTLTFYGGVFSVLPAYIADLFGQKHAGAIHGKALTAWAASAVVGPMGLAYLRSRSYQNAVEDLLQAIDRHDASALERSFGVSINDGEGIQRMVDAKTLTIEKLMELAPADFVDPSPYLYNTTLYAAAGLMSVAFVSNLAIRPLDLKKELEQLRLTQRSGVTK